MHYRLNATVVLETDPEQPLTTTEVAEVTLYVNTGDLQTGINALAASVATACRAHPTTGQEH